MLIIIKTAFASGGNCCYFLCLNSSHQKSNFTILGSSKTYNSISKIRHVVDIENKTSYLEFYYNSKSDIYANPVSVELQSMNDGYRSNKWELIDYELTQETINGVDVYSTADLVAENRQVVTNSDLKSLHTPIYGNVLTNTIPSKTFTIINSMNLSKGVYIIYGFAQYTTEFSETCNYAMYQNDSLLAICRGTGTGGGGQTPFCILSLDNTATIKFGLYQPSSITREINYNRLIAVKLA